MRSVYFIWQKANYIIFEFLGKQTNFPILNPNHCINDLRLTVRMTDENCCNKDLYNLIRHIITYKYSAHFMFETSATMTREVNLPLKYEYIG